MSDVTTLYCISISCCRPNTGMVSALMAPFVRESISHRWISFVNRLLLALNKLSDKQLGYRRFEPSWCSCDVIVMIYAMLQWDTVFHAVLLISYSQIGIWIFWVHKLDLFYGLRSWNGKGQNMLTYNCSARKTYHNGAQDSFLQRLAWIIEKLLSCNSCFISNRNFVQNLTSSYGIL